MVAQHASSSGDVTGGHQSWDNGLRPIATTHTGRWLKRTLLRMTKSQQSRYPTICSLHIVATLLLCIIQTATSCFYLYLQQDSCASMVSATMYLCRFSEIRH